MRLGLLFISLIPSSPPPPTFPSTPWPICSRWDVPGRQGACLLQLSSTRAWGHKRRWELSGPEYKAGITSDTGAVTSLSWVTSCSSDGCRRTCGCWTHALLPQGAFTDLEPEGPGLQSCPATSQRCELAPRIPSLWVRKWGSSHRTENRVRSEMHRAGGVGPQRTLTSSKPVR